MESKPEEGQIDTNLYSRQIGTFGIETMGKLIKMKVLIVGLRGLGVEVAKNLILAGPNTVHLYDPDLVRINDLGANFYCEEQHVGKVSRAEACLTKLKELNPYVKVEVVADEAALNGLFTSQQVNIVCQTELMLSGKYMNPQALNDLCRQHKVGYISSQTLGPWGYGFVDFGDEHLVTDPDGEAVKNYIVTLIQKGEETTTITCHEDKRHIYQEGDYVVLREVEGMVEINETQPLEVVKTTKDTITVKLDSSKFGEYLRQGIIENVKVPEKVSYHPWSKSYVNPVASSRFGMLELPDLAKFGRSEQLHAALFGILEFLDKEGRYPENNADDQKKCLDLSKSLIEKGLKADEGNFQVEIDEKVFKTAVSYASCSISPMAAFFGGIIAQEIVKLTGKYSTIKQWLHFDIYESLPREDRDLSPKDCRYDDQIKIYGNELQDKLKKVKLFMVGAGALGCELIKAYALMGIGCSAEGKVHCTDNDNIEVSNLNRQFLFRQANVGHSKSECACAIAKGMNKDLNVTDYMTRVGPESETVFNDDMWTSLDFVVNAVDNIHARLYVDQRCVWFEKPLLESGTLGTKANSQMIVPHKTQCYGDSTDPPEEAIPMCTLRNFPNQIEHCIEWGRDKFNELFVDIPNDLVSYLDNPKLFLAQLKNNSTSSGMVTTLTRIRDYIKMKQSASFESCVQLAKDQFNSYYDHTIQDLLSIFPKDHKDKDGQPFWSGPKRAPSAITFNAEDPLAQEFIFAYANLIATAFNIQTNNDKAAVTKISASLPSSKYVPKKIEVKLPEEEKNNQPPAQEVVAPEDEELIASLQKELDGLQGSTKKEDFSPAEFEKDDDTNFHIDFINASANLRATNYQIKNCDRQKTKMIAGKIIPAIATTTAMITGAVTAEIYKFVQGYTALEDVKNSFINLALPLFVFSEPTPVNKIKSKEYDPIAMSQVKSIPEDYTIYDKTLVDQGSLTVQELFDYLQKTYNIEIDLLTAGNLALFNRYLPNNKHAPRLAMKVEQVYNDAAEEKLTDDVKYLRMELGGSIIGEDDCDFQMPTLKYVFKK